MRGLKTWACAVVFAVWAGPALAQVSSTTGGTGGTGGITGTTARSSTSTGSSLGSSSLGSSSPSGDTSNQNGLTSLDQSNAQYSDIGITSTSSLQKSNVFSSFYGNPMAMGLSSSSGAGGFGKPLYTTTSTSTVARAGSTGRLNSSSTQSGILIPLPVQIAYPAQVQFQAAPVATPRLQADLRGVIDAGGLANARTVQVVADANNNIALRGTVKDDDEKRFVEGLVRLTPGVGSITNELTYPATSK